MSTSQKAALWHLVWGVVVAVILGALDALSGGFVSSGKDIVTDPFLLLFIGAVLSAAAHYAHAKLNPDQPPVSPPLPPPIATPNPTRRP